MRRAAKSLIKNLGKTITLLLVMFVLGCVISGAISVKQAVRNTDTNLRIDLPAIASIQADETAINEQYRLTDEYPVLEPLTMNMLSDIGTLPYVRRYNISAQTGLLGRGIERVVSGEDTFGDTGSDNIGEQVNLKGVSSAGLLDADEGVVEIISGRSFTEEEATNLSYVALVPQEFAHLNNLGVGSTLTLENIVWNDEASETGTFNEESIFVQHSYDFKIIGIFIPTVEVNTGDEWMDKDLMADIENRIYTPNAVVFEATRFQIEQTAEMHPAEESTQENPEDVLFLESVYVLHDADELDSFRVAAEEIIPEFWMVEDAGTSFGDIASSMNTINDLATIILWVAIGAAIIIVGLLVVLFLRERKHEIGIYLALGEKKNKVIVQMMIEVLSVALIALTLSFFAGNLLSSSISETMLRNDMRAGRNMDGGATYGVLDQMGVVNDMSIDEMLADYDVSLDTSIVITFFTFAIGTITIATVMPMFYIVKLSPKKIMM
jgi:putative ABC transport system permease protein